MREIILTQGQVAIVDEEDYEYLSQWKWHAAFSKQTGTFYARRNSKKVDGKSHPVHMHREVMGVGYKDKLTVDHKNTKETLDNRKSNLRLSTMTGQVRNRTLFRNSSSGLKGANYHRRIGRWQSRITVNSKTIHLGYFDTKEQAHLAYVEASERLHGEFGRTA